jgi:tetratricopeptide (TPR) repeat protein
MRIPLQSPARKILVVALSVAAASIYLVFTATEYLAAHFAAKTDLASLQKAVRLEPGNADYRYFVGRYFWLVQRSATAAVEPYQQAVALNPHQSRYWFDLAGVYQFLGETPQQEDALEHAIAEDPTTPDVAWEAANFYVVQGETAKALKEFRVVLENDPYLPPAALRICWRIDPDVDALLRDVVPPIASVYSSFLEELVSQKQTSAAAKVWALMAKLDQPVDKRYVFEYVRYLVEAHEVDQASLVWRQAASLSQLSAYEPSSENLVVNGDFSLDMLNGGFDWLYRKWPEVSFALDPTQLHSGNRSLLMTFDSQGIEDAGLRQLIVVRPNTTYQFSANFKSADIQGAGGPRFLIQDLYSQTIYFASDTLKGADFWKNVGGDFTTGPDTKLIVLRIQRFPIGDVIKGRLWIDGVRLVPQNNSPDGKL